MRAQTPDGISAAMSPWARPSDVAAQGEHDRRPCAFIQLLVGPRGSDYVALRMRSVSAQPWCPHHTPGSRR